MESQVGVIRDMRIGFRHFLPAVGLSFFCLLTYQDVKVDRTIHRHPNRYFYWSGLRLDRDPLNRNTQFVRPCPEGDPGCVEWDLLEMHTDPGWALRSLILTGFPAFLAAGAVVYISAKLGISGLSSFMASMPSFLVAWYYFLGWLIDRAITKRFRK